jgi:hypothetical protein
MKHGEGDAFPPADPAGNGSQDPNMIAAGSVGGGKGGEVHVDAGDHLDEVQEAFLVLTGQSEIKEAEHKKKKRKGVGTEQ